MKIQKNAIAVILGIVAVILILISFLSSKVLLCGTWKKTGVKESQTLYDINYDYGEEEEEEEEPEEEVVEEKETLVFDFSGNKTQTIGTEKTKHNYSINKKTILSYSDKGTNCVLFKVTGDTLVLSEEWYDYGDGAGTIYERQTFSYAWVLRIIALVLIAGAVAVFIFVKDIVLPFKAPRQLKKYVGCGVMVAVALVLVVLTFTSVTVQLGGVWSYQWAEGEKETYLELEDDSINLTEKGNATTYNIFHTAYKKDLGALSGYIYHLDGNKMYRVALEDNDETGGYEYNGGSIEEKLYKLSGSKLYIYDEGQKPAEGEIANRYGLSLVWLMRIIAIVLVLGAAAIFVFVKPKDDEEELVEEGVSQNQ